MIDLAHDRFLTLPHHPHQTPSLSPCRANVVLQQIQVCQGRVLLQSFCQSLTGEKYLQTTWWNHLKFFEIHTKEISAPSTAFFSYFRSYSHIMWSPMKWNEQAQIHSDLHDGLGTSQHQSCNLVTISPSTSSVVWIHIALPPPSWPIPQHPHHPHQTPSLSPGITNIIPAQIQVCQGRVVL